MEEIAIAPVTLNNLAMLDSALRQLAAELDDNYQTDPATLATAVCGPATSCLALLASREGRPLAAALASPVFSTIQGGAGLYVSDLWVTAEARGLGLARRILAEILREGERRQVGRFLKLTVYDDNAGARAVYDRLGFSASTGETNMVLKGAALKTLRDMI